MEFEVVNIIHIIIIWQSLFFVVVLLTPKYRKNRSNTFLTLLLLTIGLHFIYNFLFTNGFYTETLPIFSCGYGYLYGPLLFFYVRSHLKKGKSFRFIDFLHFMPFFLIIALTFSGYRPCNHIGFWLLPVMLLYCAFAFREIYRYKRVIQQVSSKKFDSEVNWLKTILLTSVIIVVIDIWESQWANLFIGALDINLEYVVQFGVLLLVNIIIFQGLKKPSLFQQLNANDIDMVSNKNTNGTKIISLSEFKETVEKHLNDKKPYLNPDLDLNSLAQELGMKPKILSQVINEGFQTNYYDFINSYRIRDAKELLLNFREMSIKEIMYEVGFNSRSVFNTVFKKKTGSTPTRFRSTE